MSKTMFQPLRLLKNPAEGAAIVSRFSGRGDGDGTSYATVRDYCESVDEIPQITPLDGDLKNVQRPWAAKTILSAFPPPARLLEIGGGEPIVSGFLSELGYDVTLVDPYDGFGNGPTDYQRYVEQFPHVKILREYLRPGLPGLKAHSFDAIFSIMRAIVGFVAGIALLVGGVGVMNMMLVSVSERVREIGIRKALGASPRDIGAQFLWEAIVLSGSGGLLGVSAGVAMALGTGPLIRHFKPSWVCVIDNRATLIALFVSVGIGVLFGFFPARRASKLDAIQAIRR